MPVLRLPQGELRDEIRQPIYDTITIAAPEGVVGERRFFSSVQGKPLSQTNLRQNNLLEVAVSYRIQGLAFDAQNAAAANAGVLPVLLENSSIALQIGEKQYWQGPLLYLGGRLSAFHALAGSSAAERVYQRFGELAVAPVQYSGRHTIDINPLQSFYAKWVVDSLDSADLTAATLASGTKMRFQFSLKGTLRRPVQ